MFSKGIQVVSFPLIRCALVRSRIGLVPRTVLTSIAVPGRLTDSS